MLLRVGRGIQADFSVPRIEQLQWLLAQRSSPSLVTTGTKVTGSILHVQVFQRHARTAGQEDQPEKRAEPRHPRSGMGRVPPPARL